jgi:hypothetical protein
MQARPRALPSPGAAVPAPSTRPRGAQLCRGRRAPPPLSSRPRAAPPRAADETTATSTPLTQDDLAAYLASGCKPREAWR